MGMYHSFRTYLIHFFSFLSPRLKPDIRSNTLLTILMVYRALCNKHINLLALNAPIATKVVCFSRLLKCLRSLYGKQCGPRSDCSYMSSLFLVNAVCLYIQFVSNARQLFATDDFSRRHFLMHFFLGTLRIKMQL